MREQTHTHEALCREWSGPSDTAAFEYLKARGFIFDGHCWYAHADAQVSERDRRALLFLHEQWEHGRILYELPPRSIH